MKANLFKKEIASITSLSGSLQHQLNLIQLIDNSAWVYKQFAAHTWLGEANLTHLLMTEAVAKNVAEQLAITDIALNWENNNPIFVDDNEFVVIRPYCAGQIHTSISDTKAMIVGEMLAKIHGLKLTHQHAQAFPGINWPSTIKCPQWMSVVIECCNNLESCQDKSWVLSHRDIHADNIIWRDDKTPWLIDWESAGLIHPGVELIGLACNCAGITNFLFDVQSFLSTLVGYQRFAGKLPEMDSGSWFFIWHSWLLWYVYAMEQNWPKEIRRTRRILTFMQQKQQDIRQLYQNM